MRKWNYTLTIAAILAFATLAVYVAINRQAGSPPANGENRIPLLQKLVEEQAQQSAQAIAAYQPKLPARIDDLSVSAIELLRQLPGVAQVDVAVQAQNPAHRIVHLRDWHFVPRQLYTIDLKNAAGRALSDADINRLHQELLLEVEAVQLEQIALLRCLIKHHGLRRLYCEGLTKQDLPDYKERIATLRAMEQAEIPELRKQLSAARALQKSMDETGRTAGERYRQTKQIETELAAMLDEHTARLRELGAAGRLLIAGEIDEVLPLDDAGRLDQAKPITPSGKVSIDTVKLTARHDAQVKAVLDNAAFGLIILGGAHDLSDSIRRLGRNRCEYIRLTTARFRELSP